MPDRQPVTSAGGRPAPEKPQDKAGRQALRGDPDGPKNRWDVIDENAWESFPASDPPSHWAGRDLTPEERAARSKAKREEENKDD